MINETPDIWFLLRELPLTSIFAFSLDVCRKPLAGRRDGEEGTKVP